MQTIDLCRLALEPGHKVLDLGCGRGRHSHAVSLLSPADVFAVDLNWQDVQSIKLELAPLASSQQLSRCHCVLGNGVSLPFTDAAFDVVICSEVLEHIHPYLEVLAEITRVLKPGGIFAVSVPRFWPEWVCWRLSHQYHQVPGGHIRLFNAKQLQKNIEQQPFRFVARHWAHALHVPYWWLRCAFWHKGETFFLVRWYHKLLVWDLMQKPCVTRAIDRALNPIMGKSVVLYFKKH